jgi:hypothetical protein
LWAFEFAAPRSKSSPFSKHPKTARTDSQTEKNSYLTAMSDGNVAPFRKITLSVCSTEAGLRELTLTGADANECIK